MCFFIFDDPFVVIFKKIILEHMHAVEYYFSLRDIKILEIISTWLYHVKNIIRILAVRHSPYRCVAFT